MKIAIAQLNFLVGDIEGNADRIIRETNQTIADLIIFPELALCGYPPEDLLFRPHFYIRCDHALKKIISSVNKPIILGYPNKINNQNYNAACFIQEGQCVVTYAKQKLPNYTVFDEMRYFTAENAPCVFDFKGIKIGIVICEDIWHPASIAQAKHAGAELIVSINASPYDQYQIEARENVLTKRIRENQLPIIYCNLVGGQDELVFDGGSKVYDEKGNRCQQAAYYQEEIMLVSIEKQNNKVVIVPQKLPEKMSFEKQLYETLKLGVHDYITKNHFPGVLIGLSGGIDSALTLTIAVDAIGADKVTALIMPSQYTAKISIEDAITEANTLGVKYEIIEIDILLNSFLSSLSPVFKNAPTDTTEENLQARIRGMLLMALSNKYGKIVLTTGNKSELSVGYATLYGDMAGGFAVIKDIYKTRVYRLAHYRNTISNVIPNRVMTRAPTAELKSNQYDQDKLPPYPILDEILERYIEQDEDAAKIIAAGFNAKMVDDIIHMINANEYKRRQAPIGIRITQRAFGKDRRYPITSGY